MTITYATCKHCHRYTEVESRIVNACAECRANTDCPKCGDLLYHGSTCHIYGIVPGSKAKALRQRDIVNDHTNGLHRQAARPSICPVCKSNVRSFTERMGL